MRSVVVVFPASMCAEMPMFRYRSMGVLRGMELSTGRLTLPAVVSEGLVGFCHAMRVFALAHGGAAVLGRIHELVSQAERHRLLAAIARGFDEPAHRESLAALRTDFDGHLVGGATDATRLHFDDR